VKERKAESLIRYRLLIGSQLTPSWTSKNKSWDREFPIILILTYGTEYRYSLPMTMLMALVLMTRVLADPMFAHLFFLFLLDLKGRPILPTVLPQTR